MLLTVIVFLAALAILVTFHEFGHFYIARLCGVKVLRFSVGFGKPIFTWTDRQGTEFVIAAVPLGGFVKMLDENEGQVAAEELSQAFTQKTVWQRIAIVSAGPIANFILAIVLYFVLALIGTKGVAPVIGHVLPKSLAAQAQLQENDEIIAVDGKSTTTWTDVYARLTERIGDTGRIKLSVKPFSSNQPETRFNFDHAGPYDSSVEKSFSIERWLGDADRPNLLSEIGIEPYPPKTNWVVSQVTPGGAAEAGDIQVGDQLISADGEPLVSWKDWVEYVQAHAKIPIELELLREGRSQRVSIVPQPVEDEGQIVGKVGIATATDWPDGMLREKSYSLFAALVYGVNKTWEQAVVIVSFLKKMIFLDVSAKNMGGTFTIAQVAGDTAKAGLTYYLGFLAFFSVSLGVFNLLPIPVLDGGHLLFYLIEAIKGKPLPEKVQLIGYQIGMFVIVSVMLLAHYNDLMRWLSLTEF